MNDNPLLAGRRQEKYVLRINFVGGSFLNMEGSKEDMLNDYEALSAAVQKSGSVNIVGPENHVLVVAKHVMSVILTRSA